MIIQTEKEYKELENHIEQLIKKGTELGGMEFLSAAEKAEFIELSEILDEYGSKAHPLPEETYNYASDYSYSEAVFA